MLKKLLIFLGIFTLLVCGCGKKSEPVLDDLQVIQARDKIIVGVRNDTKPFGYIDKSGNLAGFDIELAKMIAEYIFHDCAKVDFVVVEADNRISKLNTKEVDILIATMTITDQRLQVIDFSTPYFVAGQAVMVKSNSKFTTFNELANKRLIVVFGTTGEKSLRDIYPSAKILAFKTYSEAFDALENNEADAIVADDAVLLNYVLEHKSSVRLLSKRYSKEPYAVAFRQDEASESLKVKINEYINYLYNSGKLKELTQRYLPSQR